MSLISTDNYVYGLSEALSKVQWSDNLNKTDSDNETDFYENFSLENMEIQNKIIDIIFIDNDESSIYQAFNDYANRIKEKKSKQLAVVDLRKRSGKISAVNDKELTSFITKPLSAEDVCLICEMSSPEQISSVIFKTLGTPGKTKLHLIVYCASLYEAEKAFIHKGDFLTFVHNFKIIVMEQFQNMDEDYQKTIVS